MCNLACGITTTVLGVVLVAAASYLSFGLVPDLINNIVKGEVQLLNDTEQLERFQEVPFPVQTNVRIFNITNEAEVLAGGVPVVREVGPYMFKTIQKRVIEAMDEDTITYRRVDIMEFDAQASAPFTLDDNVTVVNVAYQGILQTAEKIFPGLMVALNLAIRDIFGINSGPIMTVRVGDLLLDGLPICKDPGLIGIIACAQIRSLAVDVRNLENMADGSMLFSILKYKQKTPSDLYVVSRGIADANELGIISTYNGSAYLQNWINQTESEAPSVCNMINGTDSGIFPPFVNRDKSIFALNTDICRSAELRYQYDTVYEEIPVTRFSANEWFLDNDDGCFCLNATEGITREDGCLLRGAMELYSCVGIELMTCGIRSRASQVVDFALPPNQSTLCPSADLKVKALEITI
ncbi:unnamed protein product, partial [Brenthis ino]